MRKTPKYVLTTAGEGTCILGTALGLTWFATWHKITPSANADERLSGNEIRRRLSIC